MTALVSCWSPAAVPHLARRADHRRHRRVDDHVARDVQVRDAAVGVDHRDVGPALEGGGDLALDRGLLVGGQPVERRAGRCPGRCSGRRPRGASASACFAKISGKNARTPWPKMIGSETFIIVAFRCSENRTPLALASAICSARNASSAARRMTAESTISPSCTSRPSLRTVTSPSVADVLDAQRVGRRHGHRRLRGAEVAVAHRRDVRRGLRRPGAHRMRVLARRTA